jgi:hypothetical protein
VPSKLPLVLLAAAAAVGYVVATGARKPGAHAAGGPAPLPPPAPVLPTPSAPRTGVATAAAPPREPAGSASGAAPQDGASGHELSHLLPDPSGVDIAVEVLEERGEHS